VCIVPEWWERSISEHNVDFLLTLILLWHFGPFSVCGIPVAGVSKQLRFYDESNTFPHSIPKMEGRYMSVCLSVWHLAPDLVSIMSAVKQLNVIWKIKACRTWRNWQYPFQNIIFIPWNIAYGELIDGGIKCRASRWILFSERQNRIVWFWLICGGLPMALYRIRSCCCLSYDRSIASTKTRSPQTAI
jgi:hypothetical protein